MARGPEQHAVPRTLRDGVVGVTRSNRGLMGVRITHTYPTQQYFTHLVNRPQSSLGFRLTETRVAGQGEALAGVDSRAVAGHPIRWVRTYFEEDIR